MRAFGRKKAIFWGLPNPLPKISLFIVCDETNRGRYTSADAVMKIKISQKFQTSLRARSSNRSSIAEIELPTHCCEYLVDQKSPEFFSSECPRLIYNPGKPQASERLDFTLNNFGDNSENQRVQADLFHTAMAAICGTTASQEYANAIVLFIGKTRKYGPVPNPDRNVSADK